MCCTLRVALVWALSCSIVSADEASSEQAERHCAAGCQFAHCGQFDKAIDELTKAIRLDPTHGDAYSDRGVVYQQIGSYEAAMADLTAEPRFVRVVVRSQLRGTRPFDCTTGGLM